MASPILQLSKIHKSFGPVQALCGVDLSVQAGEVHALIGENGAGKSTLMKILSGVHQADAGEMVFNGQVFKPRNPLESRLAGISMIYQELILAPHLTVKENIVLGLEHARMGWIQSRKAEVRAALDKLGQQEIDPDTPVNQLSIGKQQIVEIARALLTQARVVVMDEPTSSLSAQDTQALFEVIRTLREEGVAVIYISHFLEEVLEICDRYTVLRDGESVAAGEVADTSIPALATHMVGRSVDELYPHLPHTQGEVLLSVEDLKGAGGLPESVSFSLHRGEILGIAGLVGAGRSETFRNIFGLEKAQNGTITLKNGQTLQVRELHPRAALRQGLDMLSEDRKSEGLALGLPILTNITLSRLRAYGKWGWINLKREAEAGQSLAKKLRVKTPHVSQPVSSLSGGNQQKVCLARLLHHDSDILILDEPTRGIDIGSKAEIYRLIQELAQMGKAIVVISSYLPELFGICDTLSVMYKGVLSPPQPVSAWTEQAVMVYATSGNQITT